MSNWEKICWLIEANYGTDYVNWTEGYFQCPYCYELICSGDWDNLDLTDGNGNFMCPVCESILGMED